jgi:CRP-like cAMP-binding protein
MLEYLSLLKKSNMFTGINEDEIKAMLTCLSARVRHYRKNEYIIRNGEQIHSIGMVLSGLVLIEKEDFWGGRHIIQEITPGSIFAESYACLTQFPAEINVLASEDTAIMIFDMKHLLTVCQSACSFHSRLIQNLLNTIARKNMALTKKIEYLSKKTIRDKLLAYLSSESLKNKSNTFVIPFNRQELADYLSVDRSALSGEIGKLQKDGIITCRKNKFHIRTPEKQYDA